MKMFSRIGIAGAALAMMLTLGGCDVFSTYYLQSTEYDIGECDRVELWCTVLWDDCYIWADGERFYYTYTGDYYYENLAWDDAYDYCGVSASAYTYIQSDYDVGTCDTVSLYCTSDRSSCYYEVDGLRYYFNYSQEYSVWNEVVDHCTDYDYVDCTEFYGADLGNCYNARFCEYNNGYAYYEADGYKWACWNDSGDYCGSAAEQYYYQCGIN